MKRGRKGLSTIVSTLLILLLVFVAVAILWVVVRNVIQQGTEQVSLGKFTLDLKIDQVSVDESNNQVSVGIRRNQGEGEFVGIKIIVSDEENSEIYNENISLKVHGKKTFKFYLNDLNVSEITQIQIVPIFRLSSGREVSGDIKDTWEKSVSGFSSGDEMELPSEEEVGQECTPVTEDEDCTTDYYSGNFCLGEDVYRNLFDFYCNASNRCGYTVVPELVQDCSLTNATCQSSECVVQEEQTCIGDSTRSCTITNGAGQQTRTCTDGEWSSWGTCIVVSCNSGYEISGNSCVVESEEPPATGNAESSYLAGVPLIHAQTFLIPENAVNGDTVGDLNKMWIGPSQSVSFSLTNNDNGRFSINSVGRISVASANFDYDSKDEHQITVRATSSGEYNDAVITIKLSKEEKTIFIDPSYSGTETGSRSQPYKSWKTGSGKSRVTQPGYTYLQKRGTTYRNIFSVLESGTASEHIVIGAYGSGDRAEMDCSSYSGSQGIFLGKGYAQIPSEVPDYSVHYIDIYSFEVHGCRGIRTASGGTYFSFRDLDIYDNSNQGGIYIWHDLRDTENGLAANENARDQNILLEDIVAHDTPVHGIKAHAGKMTIRNILAYNNGASHGLSIGARNHEISYIRTYNNNGAGLEIGSSNTNAHHIWSYDNYYGILINEAAFDITLKDSVSFHNYAQGIGLYAAIDFYGKLKSCPNDVTIEDVESYDNSYSGIRLLGACDDIIIRNNNIYDNGDEGIDITQHSEDGSSDNIDILNNEISDNTNQGVNVQYGNDIFISGNVFCGNGADNIYASGSATNVQQSGNVACN